MLPVIDGFSGGSITLTSSFLMYQFRPRGSTYASEKPLRILLPRLKERMTLHYTLPQRTTLTDEASNTIRITITSCFGVDHYYFYFFILVAGRVLEAKITNKP